MRFFIVIAVTAGTCFGALHFVEPGQSIQANVDAAQQGDTVVLRDGIHNESVVLHGKSLTIASQFLLDGNEEHITSTQVFADTARDDTNSCFAYVYDEAPGNRLVGLTLRQGRGTYLRGLNDRYGGAICLRPEILYSNLSVENCVIVESRAKTGGGVFAWGFDWSPGTHLTLSHSRIANCVADFSGGGVYAGYCSLAVKACAFDNDSSLQSSPGALAGGDPYMEVDSCIIQHCRGRGLGGIGLSGGSGSVTNCVFLQNENMLNRFDNHLTVGHGDYVIRNNWFGPGVTPTPVISFCCQGATIRFLHNVVEGHISSLQGFPYIMTVAGVSGEIAYNLFRDNSSELMGLLYCFQETDIRIHHNVFTRNRNVGSPQGCIVTTGPNSYATLDSNWIEGNIGPTVSFYPDFPTTIDARYNWWGDPTGPYHATLNPAGQGDTLSSDGVLFDPWLTAPPDTVFAAGVPQPVFPATWRIDSVFPNPFNHSLSVYVTGFTREDFLISLHNTLGQEVEVIHRGRVSGHGIVYRPENRLAAGVYFLRARDAKSVWATKVLYLK